VMDQNPNAGTRIQKGDRVTLLVSTGPPKTSVPDVVGMNYGDAVQTLNDANLKAKKHEVFSQKPAGQVVDQDPQAGQQVVQGTEVVLDVSKGAKQVSVPNVVGMSQDEATSTLQQAGFQVSSTDAPSDSTPQGVVSDQSPDGGTQADKGSTVTITVSSGPSTTTVPDEVGQEKQVAMDDLKANGFKVKVVSVAVSDPGQENIVQDQDPSGGSQAEPGSTVTIFVGKFA
jgi:eukaryotic-like serine/threonine-protein kinase